MNETEQQATIFGVIFALANRLQILGDKLDGNITIKQWLLLAAIFKNPSPSPSLSEVGDMIGNSRQNVKKMAMILEKQGFVTLIKDVSDARMVRISLTPKCIAYFAKRVDKESQFMEKLYNGFEGDLTNGLYNGLIKLFDNIIVMEGEYETKERS
ncbi:MAG: MarR family transcriptional regulator [Gorillibacterium sp.]|nr:MarR family transcriptional regulator [Gorillibacterium sp.]